jgi:hypothetical protein
MRLKDTDRFAWAPRMDLWFIAQQARKTLPERYIGMSMAELALEMGFACHAVRGDFTLERRPGDLALRGLGFDNHPDYPYRVELRDLPMTYRQDGHRHTTHIETSAGEITFSLQLTPDMAASGISLPFVLSYPVESVDDLDRVAEVFEHLEVVPTADAYSSFHQRVGTNGVAVANGCIAASPVHLLLHELMPMDRFYYTYHDSHERIAEFSRRVTPFFDSLLDASLLSEAEVILWGANFDRDLTWPPFFETEILPWLQKVAQRMHDSNRLLLCHTDGENDGLAHLYRQSGFDVAESFCPSPMTSVPLSVFREDLGGYSCIWGGVPSVALLPDSCSSETFDRLIDDLDRELGTQGDRLSPLVLGVSDNVPPDADLARLAALTRLCNRQ